MLCLKQLTLDELGGVFNAFTRAAIDLLEELRELASNMGSVAIKHRGVACTDLTGMVQDDDLGVERLGTLGGVGLGISTDIATRREDR